MTKIIKYSLIAFVVFLATGCMTACDESHTSDGGEGTPPTLSKPSGIKVDFWEFSWSSVDNATGYVVELSGEEYLTQDSSFSLFDYVAPEEECILKVKAVGDGISFSDSEWAMTKYTAEKVTADLTYTLLENDTYSVFCPIDNIPSNGELVLPDYHQGKLVTVFEAEPGYPQSEYSEIFKVRFPVKLKEIGEGALYRSSISEIYLPSSVKSISGFEDCSNLATINLPNNVKTIGNNAFGSCTSLSKIDLPEKLTSIGGGAFANTSLTKINLPDTLTSIGNTAFAGTFLTKIDFPDALTSIGISAFKNTSLSKVEIPDSVTKIGEGAFDNTPWYNSQADGWVYCGNFLYTIKGEIAENTVLTLPSSIKGFVNAAIFKNQTNLISITLPEGIKEIPAEMFSGCINLRQVILPDSVTVIQSRAFENCKNLTGIILPKELTEINWGAFCGSGLKSVTIPQGVINLGTNGFVIGIFSGCTDLVSVTIPGSVELIGGNTFKDCTSLQYVTIEEGVEVIEAFAFSGCTLLKEITLPDSVTKIALSAFEDTGITSFVLPKNLKEIDSFNKKTITSLLIPNGMKFLDYNSFYLCEGLHTFYFMGTEVEWEQIEIDRAYNEKAYSESQAYIDEQNALIAAWEKALTVYYYSEAEPPKDGNRYWHYVDGVPTPW